MGVTTKTVAANSQYPMAIIALCNPKLQMLFITQLSTTHCVCAEIRAHGISFYVVSYYFQYKDKIEGHLRHLETVLRSLKGERILVTVDANARSSLWGNQGNDERGNKFEDLIRAHGMHVINDIRQGPTYQTTRGTSYIDVTLASPQISHYISEWKVRGEWTTSDHKALSIIINIKMKVNEIRENHQRGNERTSEKDNETGSEETRFNVRKADWEQFSESLESLSEIRLKELNLNSVEETEHMAKELSEVLVDACKESMLRRGIRRPA